MPPRKIKRNASGLRNQKPRPPLHAPEPEASEPQDSLNSDRPSELVDENDEEPQSDEQADLAGEDGAQSMPGPETETHGEVELLGGDSVAEVSRTLEVSSAPAKKHAVNRADTDDDEWVPSHVRYQRQQCKQEKKPRGLYIKGPDVASKSERTQRRYKGSIATQSKLDGHFTILPRSSKPEASGSIDSAGVARDGDNSSV